jgi:ElaB/YqjD/DUF883 family membrane-anchored ribosome-binding protein
MDQQQIKSAATDMAEKLGEAGDNAVQAGANIQQRTLDQGKAMSQDFQASAASAARQAANTGRQAMGQARESVQDAAREIGEKTTQAASVLYQQGSLAGGYITRFTTEQPATALFIAAAIGYGLAYLIHRN